MTLPVLLQRYIEFQRASFRGVRSPIGERWVARIVTRKLHDLGEQGAEIYLKQYGTNISERKVVELALKAEIEGYPEMAVGFWKKAYEIAELLKDGSVATTKSQAKQLTTMSQVRSVKPQNPPAIIARKKRRLAVLEEHQAIKGINAPPEVITEIEDLRREISELET